VDQMRDTCQNSAVNAATRTSLRSWLLRARRMYHAAGQGENWDKLFSDLTRTLRRKSSLSSVWAELGAPNGGGGSVPATPHSQTPAEGGASGPLAAAGSSGGGQLSASGSSGGGALSAIGVSLGGSSANLMAGASACGGSFESKGGSTHGSIPSTPASGLGMPGTPSGGCAPGDPV
jgi:hypothetical protein